MRGTLASYSFDSDGKDFSLSIPLANMELMKPFLLIGLLVGSLNAAPQGWPGAVLEIKYPSKADNSEQPALYYKPPESASMRPLLVGLNDGVRVDPYGVVPR